MSTYRDLPFLAAAINAESYAWLEENQPVLADALRQEIRQGATPEQVRQFSMRATGRVEISRRLEQAAAHLAGMGKEA